MRRLRSLVLLLLVPLPLFGQVVLSEFQAANVGTLRDEDGDTEDWIEICNTSRATVDLTGWYLTDDANLLKKWQFPSTNLAGGRFLVIFASNKDRRQPGAPLHTNFKLSASGEYLALVKPDGVTLATAYAPVFPPQADGISYGLPLSTETVPLLAPGAVGKLLVPSDGTLGTNWIRPEFDDTQWRDARTGVGFDVNHATVLVPLADSVNDWNVEGVQGSLGWYYGYYDKTADASPGYQTNEFVPYPRSDQPYGLNNFWNGTQYWWPVSTGFWDLLGQTDIYPTGINHGAEHWVIRRWQSPRNAIVQARWQLSKASPNGSGVTGQLYCNGILQDGASIAGADTIGIDHTVTLGTVRTGDVIDLALTPVGPDGTTDDAGDAARNALTLTSLEPMTNLISTDLEGLMHGSNGSVYLRLPFVVSAPEQLDQLTLRLRYNDGFVAYLNGVQVAARNAPTPSPGGTQADSLANWSNSGQQGLYNWYYGFYNQATDADGVYDAASDFNSTDPQWTWNGNAWLLGPGDPPRDFISAGSWQPNGSNSGGVHWPIRRWISLADGSINCRLTFAKEQSGCGSGVTLHVLQNGVERFNWTLADNDLAGLQTNLVLGQVRAGDYLDFALDPRGTDGNTSDACDRSTFSVVIEQSPSDGPVWNSTATAARSPQDSSTAEEINLTPYRDWVTAGTNVLAFQILNCTPNDGDLLLFPELIAVFARMDTGRRGYFTEPTPGAANGPGTLTIGPMISEVSQTPLIPGDGDDLYVKAKITPTLHPVAGVTLAYRVMYGGETRIQMADDGAHGDGAAGDSIYGAVIPAAASNRGQMVRYYLLADDLSAQQTRAPNYLSPTRSPQYFGTVIVDPNLTNALPVLQWFIQTPSAADSDYGARCSVWFNGEFYDNVGVTVHGQSTRSFPKKSYDFDFNPGYKFRWSPDAPKVGDINLLTTWGDKSHLRSILAYETYRDGGAPGHFAFAVRVQQNVAFFSVANVVESGDDDFLKRLGLDPQGALYKMYNSAESVAGAEKKTRKYEGTADLQALISGMGQSASAAELFMFDNLDVPEVVDFLAAKMLTGDADCCFKNYYLYRDSDGTGEWQAMPWDVDLSFGHVWTCGSPCLQYYDDTIYTNQSMWIGADNVVLSKIYSTPATRQMFLRRLRSLMDQLLQPPGTPATGDSYRLKSLGLRDKIAPDAALDLAKWGTWGSRQTITQAVDRIGNEFLPGRRAYLFTTQSVTNRGEIPLPQPPDPLLQINALEYRPASGNPLQEWLSITNANSYAVDLSNWRLDGGVRFTFKPGTVVPARSGLIVSPDVKAFRNRLVSPKGHERRLVVGPYEGNLSAWGEGLILVDAAGRLVHSNYYTGNPSPAQQYLRVTEIFYNPDPFSGNTSLDPQLFEFLELRNIGPDPLDLRGVRFTEGVAFDFTSATITNLPPGGRALLVRDTTAFALRYGAGLLVAGQYSGKLDNSGERLRLEDQYGEKILDFSYDPGWYPSTDGQGFSLVIADDTLPWSAWGDPASWRPSGISGGTPGQGDLLLHQISITPLGTGFRLLYRGTPGMLCEFERSADTLHWTSIQQLTIPSSGVVEFIEAAPAPASAYYRALETVLH